jgi:hypothetical protein
VAREGWRPFLERWSEEWITAHDPERDAPLDPEVVEQGWLGFSPAAPEAVAALEERLGLPLPPSLRGFLEVTDGWRDAGHFVYRLGGTAEIGFLRDMDPVWIEAYAEAYDEGFDEDEEGSVGPLLRRAVQISLDGDACVLFLDPETRDGQGEWAAYELASWSGEGPRYHASFHDLMYSLYRSFHALRKPENATQRGWDEKVEEARLAALAGEVDGPLGVFAEAHGFGRDRAQLLGCQMTTLLGGGGPGTNHLVRADGEPAWIVGDPVFADELLPLLFAEHRQRDYGASTLEFLMGNGTEPGPLQLMIAGYEARTREPGFRLRFGTEAFDRAVHAVLDGLAGVPAVAALRESLRGGPVPAVTAVPGFDAEQRAAARRALDGAWPGLRDAIGLWRPLSDHHIAPVVLLADPVLREMITPERGREILATARGGR